MNKDIIGQVLNNIIDSIIIKNEINTLLNNLIDSIPTNSYKENNYGCEHYKRKCKLIMPCCNN